jgi:hypothetical protein
VPQGSGWRSARSCRAQPHASADQLDLRLARFADFLRGTFLPARRASDSPIAMACLRLLTVLPDRPLRSLPRFISRIVFLTFRPAALLYLRAMHAPVGSARDEDRTYGAEARAAAL